MGAVSIIRETGRPVTIKDEGVTLTPSVSSIDFTGSGRSSSAVGDLITDEVPGVGLVSATYDYVSYTRDANNFTSTITFKAGGSGGSTVATIVTTRNASNFTTTIVTTIGASVVTRTIARDANNYITSITKS